MWKFTSIHTVIHVGSNGSLVNSNKDSLIDCYFYFFGKAILIDVFFATSNVPLWPNSERELCVLVNTKTKGWPDPDSAVCAPSRQLPSHTLERGSKASSADGVWHLGLGSGTSSCHIRHSWRATGCVGWFSVKFNGNEIQKKASGHPEPVYCLCSVVERWNFIIFFSWNRTLRLCSAHVELRS